MEPIFPASASWYTSPPEAVTLMQPRTDVHWRPVTDMVIFETSAWTENLRDGIPRVVRTGDWFCEQDFGASVNSCTAR